MKRITIIICLVAIGLLGIYLNYWYRYKKSMDEVSRNWYEKEYFGKEIKGVLKSITEFNDNPFEIVLLIKNEGEEFDVRYGVTCVDKEFRNFVQVGDNVFKMPGEKIIRFCKTKNSCKEYELNFCNKFK
jgi:hypothetical protein